MGNVVEHFGQLLTSLRSPDFNERENAVRELGSHNEDAAVTGLVMALEDPDTGIREMAADHLAAIAGVTAAPLLIRFLGHDDIGTRNLAAEILVTIGAPAVPAMLQHIEDDDIDVRKFLVDILGRIRDERAVEPVCQRLRDGNTNVVCSAAEALGEIGSAKAAVHLIATYARTEDARLPVVEALGKIGDRSTLKHLYEFLKTDDVMIRYATLEAIGRIGVSDSVKKLAPFLYSPDRAIAETALMAIIHISNRSNRHDRGATEDLPLHRFTSLLFDGIRNRNEDVTKFTLNRLTHWHGNTVIEELLGTIDFVDDDIFRWIADILAGVGYPAGKMITKKLATASNRFKIKLLDVLKYIIVGDLAEEILPLADVQDPEVRQRVAHLLGISGYSRAIQTLKKLALDANGHVRAAALSALGWLCAEDDIDFIMTGLDDRYPEVREAAAGAMIIIGGPKAIAKFSADLYHPEIERQRLAVKALGWIGELDVIDPLLRATSHPDAAVRKSAINALARVGHLTDMEAIKATLQDENSAVRKAAISALVSLEGTNAIHDIRPLLEDEDVWVRYHAIGCVGEMGKKEFAEYLLPSLEADLDIVRIAAARAMSVLGDRRAIPTLNKMVGEKNRELVPPGEAALLNTGDR